MMSSDFLSNLQPNCRSPRVHIKFRTFFFVPTFIPSRRVSINSLPFRLPRYIYSSQPFRLALSSDLMFTQLWTQSSSKFIDTFMYIALDFIYSLEPTSSQPATFLPTFASAYQVYIRQPIYCKASHLLLSKRALESSGIYQSRFHATADSLKWPIKNLLWFPNFGYRRWVLKRQDSLSTQKAIHPWTTLMIRVQIPHCQPLKKALYRYRPRLRSRIYIYRTTWQNIKMSSWSSDKIASESYMR